MAKIDQMIVSVAYATQHDEQIIILEVNHGSTVSTVIEQSGILDRFPEIRLQDCQVGVFSQRCELDDCVIAGSRIEIYRPLIIDPKEARRKKAKKGGARK